MCVCVYAEEVDAVVDPVAKRLVIGPLVDESDAGRPVVEGARVGGGGKGGERALGEQRP